MRPQTAAHPSKTFEWLKLSINKANFPLREKAKLWLCNKKHYECYKLIRTCLIGLYCVFRFWKSHAFQTKQCNCSFALSGNENVIKKLVLQREDGWTPFESYSSRQPCTRNANSPCLRQKISILLNKRNWETPIMNLPAIGACSNCKNFV